MYYPRLFITLSSYGFFYFPRIYLISKNCFDFCVPDVSISIYETYDRVTKEKVEVKIDAFRVKIQDSLRKCHSSIISIPILLILIPILLILINTDLIISRVISNISAIPFKINIASFDVDRAYCSLLFLSLLFATK